MGTYYIDPGAANDNGSGTSGSPYKYVPKCGYDAGKAGAVNRSQASNDIYYIKNGTTIDYQLFVAGNNITFAGYGVDANSVLYLTLPETMDCTKTRTVKVVRKEGEHEGMWKVSNTATYPFQLNNYSGTVIEDMWMESTSSNLYGAVQFGWTNTPNGYAVGLTVRRSYINEAARNNASSSGCAIGTYGTNITVEWCKFNYCWEEAVVFGASGPSNNNYRTGSTDILRYCHIIEPGQDGELGDCFQTYEWEGQQRNSLTVHDLYIQKTTGTKQMAALVGLDGGCTLRNIHFAGGVNGSSQIILTSINGNVTISDIYVTESQQNNAFIRFGTAGYSGRMLGTSKTITVERVFVAATTHNGLFTMASSERPSTAFTVTVASPGVVTYTGNTPWNAIVANDIQVTLKTSGSLPGGLSVDTTYYVKNLNAGAKTFELSATLGGASINTTGSAGSGHTVYWGTNADFTIDGAMIFRNCTLIGSNTQGWSFSGGISLHDSSITAIIGNNATGLVENCIVHDTTSPGSPANAAIRLPSGVTANGKWVVRNNWAKANGAFTVFTIGGSTYTTVSAFQSAYADATNNKSGTTPDWGSDYRPTGVGADIYAAGKHTAYRKVRTGVGYWNPPSMGALECPRSRTTVSQARIART